MENYGSAYSNWLDLYSNFSQDYYEIVICGEDAKERLQEINQKYIPNKLLCGSLTNSELPLLRDRFNKNKTLVYVCVNNTCQHPTEKTNEALKLIKT